VEVAPEACPSCGLAVAGGAEGCVVDVYAMQHPDRYGRSAKSFAAHLTGLCAWLENEGGAQSMNASVQRWLSGPSPIVKPPLPPSYGAITIRELVDAEDPLGYGAVLRRWARSTWDAYAQLHATARKWIATAVTQHAR
jgi:hypothetical protein